MSDGTPASSPLQPLSVAVHDYIGLLQTAAWAAPVSQAPVFAAEVQQAQNLLTRVNNMRIASDDAALAVAKTAIGTQNTELQAFSSKVKTFVADVQLAANIVSMLATITHLVSMI